MFEQSSLDFSTGKSRKGWTVLLSLGIEVVLLAAAVVLPLLFTDTLQVTFASMKIDAPPPPKPPDPPTAKSAAPLTRRVYKGFRCSLCAPREIPKTPSSVPDVDIPDLDVPTVDIIPGPTSNMGVAGPHIDFGGILPGPPPLVDRAKPEPIPPKQAAVKSTTPQRVSSGVSRGLLVKRVSPVYPASARITHVQGMVVLTAAIGKDGKIRELKVASGPALLRQAALEAVSQWEYRPYLLSGEPVEVYTEIEVNFTLSQ